MPAPGSDAGEADAVGAPPTVPPAPPLVPLRRNRDFVLLWTGQTVSALGTRVTSIAYPLLVLATSGSPARAGIVAFAQTLPYLLLYLPAGALVDRWDRKRTMVVSDGLRGVAMATVAVALGLDRLTFAHLVLVAFVEGSLFVFFNLAENAALPKVVHPQQLPTAIAQNEARLHAADLAGQPLGGALFQVSRALPFVADAVTYAASTVALLFVRAPLQDSEPPPRQRLRADIAEGVRFLWHERFLRLAVAMIGGVNFAFNALFLVIVVRAEELGASPSLIGVLLAFYGAGGLVGAALAPRLARLLPRRTVLVATTWVWALDTAALVLVEEPWLLGPVAAVSTMAGPTFNVVVTTYRYEVTPNRLLARVQSVGRLVAWGSIPLGSLFAGLVTEQAGTRTAFVALAAVMAAMAVLTTVAPSMRLVEGREHEYSRP